MRRLLFAIQRHNQRQSHGNFRRRNRNRKEHKNLSIEIIVKARERHQREICRIEHQFQRHINHQHIAPDDYAKKPEREQQETDRKVMLEAYMCHFRSFLLSKITPTIATSSSTEIISNGSRYCENSRCPSSAVPALKSGARVALSVVAPRLLKKIARMVPTEITPPITPRSLICRRSSAFKSSNMMTNRNSTITAP